MSQDYVVAKRITITQAKAVLEVGDSVIFKPENHNSLTVYRNGDIYKTFDYSQVGVDALVRTGTLAEPPPAEPKALKPKAPSTPVPAAVEPEKRVEKPAVETPQEAETPKTETPEPETTSTESEAEKSEAETKEPAAEAPTPETKEAETTSTDDVDPALEVPGHYDTYTKKDLIAYATKNDITIDVSQSRKTILALVMAAHPSPVPPAEAEPKPSPETAA